MIEDTTFVCSWPKTGVLGKRGVEWVMSSKQSHVVDSVVVITLLTTDPKRRDEIDQLLDEALAKDPRIQAVRVVGYSSPSETVAITRSIAAVAAVAHALPKKEG
jgi:hypothetical protein